MATGFVIVPPGWERDVVEGRVFYKSPDMKTLRNREELLLHLTSDGTCKCGLRCPFQLEEQFSFDPLILSLPDNGIPSIVQASCKVGHTHSSPLSTSEPTRSGERGSLTESARPLRLRSKSRISRRRQSGRLALSEGSGSSVSVVSMGTKTVATLGIDDFKDLQKSQSLLSNEKTLQVDAPQSAESPTKHAHVSEMSVRGLLAQLPGGSSPSSAHCGKQRTTDDRRLFEEKQRASMVALRLLQTQKEMKVRDKSSSPTLSAVLSGGSAGGDRRRGERSGGGGGLGGEGRGGGVGEWGGGGGGDGEFTVSITLNEQTQNKEAMSCDVTDTLPSTNLAGGLEHSIAVIEQRNGDMKTLESDSENRNARTTQFDPSHTGTPCAPPPHTGTPCPPPSHTGTPCPPPSHSGTSQAPLTPANVHSHSSQGTPTNTTYTAESNGVGNSKSEIGRDGDEEMREDISHLLSELCSSADLVGGEEAIQLPSNNDSERGSHSNDITCQVGTGAMYSCSDVTENVSEWFQNETNALQTPHLLRETVSLVKENSCPIGEGDIVEPTVDNVHVEGIGGGVALMTSSDTHVPFTAKVSPIKNGRHLPPSHSTTPHISPLTRPLMKLPLLSDSLTPAPDTSDSVETLLAALVPDMNSEPRARNGVAAYNDGVLTPSPSGDTSHTLSTITESCRAEGEALSHPIDELSLLTPDSSHLDQNGSILPPSPLKNLSSSFPTLSKTGRTPHFGDVPIKECSIKLRPIGREWTPKKRQFSECDTVLREGELTAACRLSEGGEDMERVSLQPKKLKFSISEENNNTPLPGPCSNGQPIDQLPGDVKTVQPNLEIGRPNIPPISDPTYEQISVQPSSVDETTHSRLVCVSLASDSLHSVSAVERPSDGCISEAEEVNDVTTASGTATEASPPVEMRSIATSTQEGVWGGGDVVMTSVVGDGGTQGEGEGVEGEGVTGGSVEGTREVMEGERVEGEEVGAGEGASGGSVEGERGEGEEGDRGEGVEGERGEGVTGGSVEGTREVVEGERGEGEEGAPDEGITGEGEREEEESTQGEFGWLHILAQVAVEASPTVEEPCNFCGEVLSQETASEQQTTAQDTVNVLHCKGESDRVGEEEEDVDEEQSCTVVPQPQLPRVVPRRMGNRSSREEVHVPENTADSAQRAGGRGSRKLRVRGRTIGQKRAMGRNTMRKISIGGIAASLVCGTEEKGDVDVTGDTTDYSKVETTVADSCGEVRKEGIDTESEKSTEGEREGGGNVRGGGELCQLSAVDTRTVNGWSAMHDDKNCVKFTNEDSIPLKTNMSAIPIPNTSEGSVSSAMITNTVETVPENNCGSSDNTTKSHDTGHRSSDGGVVEALACLEKRVRGVTRGRGGRRGRGRGRRRGNENRRQSVNSTHSEGEIHTCSSEAEAESRRDGMEWDQSGGENQTEATAAVVNETMTSNRLAIGISQDSSTLTNSVSPSLSVPTSSASLMASSTATMASPAHPIIPTKNDSFRSQLHTVVPLSSSEPCDTTTTTSGMVVSIPLCLVEVVHYRCLHCYSVSQFQAGDVVWAKAAQLPGWPGTVINHSQWKKDQLKPAPQGKRWVKWYGDGTVSLVNEKSMKPLSEGLEKRMMRKTTKGLQRAINLALKALKRKEEQMQKL